MNYLQRCASRYVQRFPMHYIACLIVHRVSFHFMMYFLTVLASHYLGQRDIAATAAGFSSNADLVAARDYTLEPQAFSVQLPALFLPGSPGQSGASPRSSRLASSHRQAYFLGPRVEAATGPSAEAEFQRRLEEARREANTLFQHEFVALANAMLVALTTLEREACEKMWRAAPVNVVWSAVAPPASIGEEM